MKSAKSRDKPHGRFGSSDPERFQLNQYSFPMMFPNRHYPNENPEQMLSLVRFISTQFMSSGQATAPELNKLQIVLNKIYQAMPAKTQQEAYNDYVVTALTFPLVNSLWD